VSTRWPKERVVAISLLAAVSAMCVVDPNTQTGCAFDARLSSDGERGTGLFLSEREEAASGILIDSPVCEDVSCHAFPLESLGRFL
jgi:hypothetical protein